MKANVGNTDKTIRLILGILIIAAGVYYESWWGALGLIPLVTGFVEFCPLYAMLGLSSCPRDMGNVSKV